VVLSNAGLFKLKSNVTFGKKIFIQQDAPQRIGNPRKATNGGFRRVLTSYSLMMLPFKWKLSSSNLQINNSKYLRKILKEASAAVATE